MRAFAIMFLSLAFGCQLIAATFENQQKLADLIKFVQSADPTNLSNELRDVHEFLKADKRNTNYCCAVPARNETVETRTRIVTFNTIETSQHIIGYEICGNLTSTLPPLTTKPSSTGFTRPTVPPCPIKPIYETVTHLGIQYKLETYLVTVVTVNCPAEHLICCPNYTMISGQCIANSLLGNLQDLINLGLIG